MSIKQNARTAWKEMEKMVGLDKPEDASVPMTELTQDIPTIDIPAPEVEAPAYIPEPAPVVPVREVARKETTTIAAGTVITGSISTDGDVQINGTIRGDLECGGTLHCRGTVEGNVSAQGVVLTSARIRGNIKAAGAVLADADSMVVGNLQADNVVLDGKLKGDLFISGMTKLECHAVLLGDITTDKLSIHEGSRFSGSLKMATATGQDLGSLFPVEHD